MKNTIQKYKQNLFRTLNSEKLSKEIEKLYETILSTWKRNNQIFICGNGGSAGNAIHIANDYLYGAGISNNCGLKVEALSSNQAVITCLANDLGYEHIYSEQLKVKAKKNDLLIILSGSGNSKNVVNAIRMGNKIKMKTFAFAVRFAFVAVIVITCCFHFRFEVRVLWSKHWRVQVKEAGDHRLLPTSQR